MTLVRVIEALLFSAQKPLTTRELRDAVKGGGGEDELAPNEFAKTSEAEIAAALEQLKIEFIEQGRAFQLLERAEGWQLASDPAYAPWVRQLFPAAKPARLTPPALETLAIVAYRQPITRADVEAVRGVAVDGVLQSLMERGLVKIGGRAEVPGRPLLYETTQFFLDHFGLKNLDELPNADELRKRYLPTATPASAEPTQPELAPVAEEAPREPEAAAAVAEPADSGAGSAPEEGS
ncbi:MAG TPA: SMC-Scp complex subunit ScpB [Chthoniobacterales bacterium]